MAKITRTYIFALKSTKMKKSSVLVLTIAIMAIMSCKKEYNCRCSVSALGIPVFDTSMSLGKLTKKDAKSRCDGYQNSIQAAASLAASMGVGISITSNCDIER